MDVETKNEFNDIRQEMSTEFNAVRKEMTTEFNAVRKEMSTEFNAVRERLDYADFDRKCIWRELKDVRLEMHDRFDKLTSTIDCFLKLHLKLDVEQMAVHGRCDRLESRIEHLESR